MNKHSIRIIVLTIVALFLTHSRASNPNFYAYYTKIEANADFEDYEITDKYPDIVVNLDENLQFIFCRSSSYLPYLQSGSEKHYVKELIPRSGDGSQERPDQYNKYSYVRIIENSPKKIVIHWRYFPDFNNLNFDGVVHEIFTIKPDKNVTRKMIRGRKKLKIFRDPGNVMIQKLVLTSRGIEERSVEAANPIEKPLYDPVDGAPVISRVVNTPLAWWKFDEGLQESADITLESVSGANCEIGGNGALWKRGVSGTALAFDGYYTKVMQHEGLNSDISEAFTIESWIVLGVYPYDWVAIAHQCEWEERGWFFGVDEHGHPALMLAAGDSWNQIRSSKQIPLNEWVHVAATFDKADGRCELYINGEKTDEETINTDDFKPAEKMLQIGLNTMKLPASGFPTIIGIEGLIDELKIYDKPLSEDAIANSYENLKPSETDRKDPDLQKRTLPRAVEFNGFGAHYTKLEYHDLWDNMWRTTDWPDVAVTFDDLPTSVLFWRGPNYGPGFVTENNKWMIDQSVETGYEEFGCCEHMSDKQCRFAHVRIIENTPARAVVHWRYAFISTLDYRFPDNFPPTNEVWEPHKSWIDEYYTIYPDGLIIRKMHNHCGASVYWQDIQFLIPAGETPEDQMHLQALTLGDIQVWAGPNFEKLELSWENGLPENTLEGANIELVNLKSKYKVFLIFPEGVYARPWVAARPGFYSKFVSWNHWPAAQIPSDGRGSLYPDRLSHSALAAADNAVFHGNVVMYGFTKDPVDSLQNLTLSWNYPPPVKRASGAYYHGFDLDQRAYCFDVEKNQFDFDFIGSEVRPIYNPCFIFKNWSGGRTVDVTINGKKYINGQNMEQGIVRDTDGKKMLIVWIKLKSEGVNHVQIDATS